jgi:hypothetical protein
MAKITLLLDEDVRPILGEILRQRGYDAVHVLDAGRTGQSDAEQLAYAVSQRRTILTHNIRHFRLLNKIPRRRQATLRDLTFSAGTAKRFIAPSSSVFGAPHRR